MARRSDVFKQYSQDEPSPVDPLGEMSRAKGQLSSDRPKFTAPPTPYSWGPHPYGPSGAPPGGRAISFGHGGRGGGDFFGDGGEIAGHPAAHRKVDIHELAERLGDQDEEEPQATGRKQPQPPQQTQQVPNSFGSPEQYQDATAGGRGGNIGAVLGKQPGVTGDEPMSRPGHPWI